MEGGIFVYIVFCLAIFLSLIGLGTFLVVVKIYKMHDVKGDDGQYSWMFPREWGDLHVKLTDSQEKIAIAFQDLAESNKKERELLGHLVNAAFSLTEEINGLKNAKK
jgi:hypothetical protein